MGRPTLGLILIGLIGLPFFADGGFLGDRALASQAPSAQTTPLRITSPTDGSVLGDGNLVLIEATAVDRAGGRMDRVEVAIDGRQEWRPAEPAADDPTRWRFLWQDPAPGFHRVRARAFGLEGQAVAEQSVIVQVQDVWTSTYIIDNPYAVPGIFRKGQLHAHSTSSFDGQDSMPPAHLALGYKRRGYEFLVITDHDLISHPKDVQDETFITIPGYESTADSGHIGAAFVDKVVSPSLPPQQRIDHINASGGLAFLAHPGWRIGWAGTDFTRLQNYLGIEIFTGKVSGIQERSQRNIQLWHQVLNAKGHPHRVWAVAVDDAHEPDEMDRGWVMVKAARLEQAAIQTAVTNGAFYASNGPSFRVLGVLNGTITAASPDAEVIRFIDHGLNVVAEGPAAWAGYRPSGAERWIRVEAVAADGRTAWSQPFWLVPNAPRAEIVRSGEGAALVGSTLPRARVHVSDHGQYLGSAVARDDGAFAFRLERFEQGSHELWMMATAPWPDLINSPPTLMSFPAAGRAAGEESAAASPDSSSRPSSR